MDGIGHSTARCTYNHWLCLWTCCLCRATAAPPSRTASYAVQVVASRPNLLLDAARPRLAQRPAGERNPPRRRPESKFGKQNEDPRKSRLTPTLPQRDALLAMCTRCSQSLGWDCEQLAGARMQVWQGCSGRGAPKSGAAAGARGAAKFLGRRVLKPLL